MKLSKITAVALAASLGMASIAQAQPDHRDRDRRDADPRPGASAPHNGRSGPQQAQQGARRGDSPQARHEAPGRPGAPMARGAGPDHQFHKGQRLPAEWRHRQHVVSDWRTHQLTPPPRGQQWVQVGADFVLVAIATGVITSLILNH